VTPPAAHGWDPGDYYLAVNGAHRTWVATQPQLTIEGFDDALDEGDVTPRRGSFSAPLARVSLVERAPSHLPGTPTSKGALDPPSKETS
jgi:hypothetical protein